jgi:hypothetical protein
MKVRLHRLHENIIWCVVNDWTVFHRPSTWDILRKTELMYMVLLYCSYLTVMSSSIWLPPPGHHLDSFIHSSMALQPFVGPWPLLQFQNLFYTDSRTPWTSDQPVARPLPKHRATEIQDKRIYTPNIHALSGIRTHDPSVRASEDSSCLRPRDHCDQPSVW